MARRQGPTVYPHAYAQLPTTVKPPSRTAEDRHHHDAVSAAPPPRAIRFWLILLLATFLLFERATVFATPSPQTFAAAALARFNVSAQIPLSRPRSSRLSATQFSMRGPANSAAVRSTDRPRDSSQANVAYFVQVAENTINHLPRLLRVIHHDQNVYAIHFDLKIPQHLVAATLRKVRANAAYDDNVHIMDSELITYRGISMLLNTISAMRLLLEKSKSWDYFVNLSGADYPLLTPLTTRRLLGMELGLNYFSFAPKRTWDNMAENRLAQVWFDESLTFRKNASVGQLRKIPGRNPLVDGRQFEVSHAEAWMISSRKFCEFVITGDMARKMLMSFAYAVDSSEHYFASLAWNHKEFRQRLVPHSLRMIVWLHDGVLSGQHPYFVDEVDEEGKYKFKQELSDSVLFFARKFDKTNSDLMDWLDDRASDKDVIAAATRHITNKVKQRNNRIAEL